MYGYCGQLLEVDLTTQRWTTIPLDDRMVLDYVGGRGFGARLLTDMLLANTPALSPSNPLMFLLGPLTATPSPGSGKFVVVTKSPLTGGWVESYSSGSLAPAIKATGFDGVVIKGAADSPAYLYMSNESIEIRDASTLWGLDCFETECRLKDTEGSQSLAVSCIGPAGENCVPFACISTDRYRQAGRGGVGAVMGSKKLKAIVVAGSSTVRVKDPRRLLSLLKRTIELARTNPRMKRRAQVGTSATMLVTNATGILPVRNFQKTYAPEAENVLDANGVEKRVIHTKACRSCPSPCGIVTTAQIGEASVTLEGPEYETLALLGSNLENYNLSSVINANELCDRLGMDTISAGNVIGFAMECVEKGILPKEYESFCKSLRFGNWDTIPGLLNDIAHRRGIGELLSLGVKKSAEVVGENSQGFAMHVKGLELPGYDARPSLGGALAYAVVPRGGCHRRSSPIHFLIPGDDPTSPERKAELAKRLFDERSVAHSLIVCDFVSRGVPVTLAEYCDYLEAVTGIRWEPNELILSAERTETLIRLFNLREGFSKDDDTLPQRFLKEAIPGGPGRGKFVRQEDLEFMVQEYYQRRGWDKDGRPTEATLRRLGL